MNAPWWDDFHQSETSNLDRMLAGRVLSEDPDGESGVRGFSFTVDHVSHVSVGIDSKGFFCQVAVLDTEGNLWTLGDEGEVSDSRGSEMGRHNVNWSLVRDRDEIEVPS